MRALGTCGKTSHIIGIPGGERERGKNNFKK